MKSPLNKEKPKQFTFLKQCNKRNIFTDLKNREIQRSNAILYKKIQNIEKKGCTKNSYISTISPHHQNSSLPNHHRLLHQSFRKQQLVKVLQQNQDMLKRIQNKKSSYNLNVMQKQRRQIQRNIELISQFKYKNYPETKTKVNFYRKNEDKSTNLRMSERQVQPRCKTTMRARLNESDLSSFYFSQSSRQINSQHYMITTYLSKGMFFIEVENLKNCYQKYRMQMQEEQVCKILEKYGNKIQKLVQNLQIDGQSCYLKVNSIQK